MKIQTSTTSFSSIHPVHQASKSTQCSGCQRPQILLFLPYSCDTITIAISPTVVSKLILIQLVLFEANFG